jgi:hypothetical protein
LSVLSRHDVKGSSNVGIVHQSESWKILPNHYYIALLKGKMRKLGLKKIPT